MDKTKILVVDDDLGVLKQLKWALEDEYEVLTASSKKEALEAFKTNSPDLVALDVNLDGVNKTSQEGLDILDEIKQNNNSLSKVIMITGNDTKEIALEAIQKGAFDYYLKPVKVDELKIILKRARYIQTLEKENQRLSQELADKFKFEDMVGNSDNIQDIFKLIRRVAPTDATVLITGESGTGKELVAKAIHYQSPRAKELFIVINCGAIPENLLESELFGHEKGSFTDAHVQKIGKLEVANGGTVFLDEIGEMSLNLQVKILRFLQERVIERVGGNNPIELDVRVIAATNSDLTKRIKQNNFREDLYYRLSVINIALPALRERGDDILLLAKHFLNKYRFEVSNKEIKGFSKEAKEMMQRFNWPGNIRELENRVRRALILAENSFITPSELGFDSSKEEKNLSKLSLKQARQKIEVEYIQKALAESKGNVSLAAKLLGLTRPTFYDLAKKYSIEL
ncbi:MAG: PEP-CTERM-box response regulator transcription factor [Candidatus Omnitrophica bacterium]|jgi:two-component system NtrC family response regulator|nr:PEP-CTERM-box response regulator transcription factor [Candidatus Omnitrophota bacterium]